MAAPVFGPLEYLVEVGWKGPFALLMLAFDGDDQGIFELFIKTPAGNESIEIQGTGGDFYPPDATSFDESALFAFDYAESGTVGSGPIVFGQVYLINIARFFSIFRDELFAEGSENDPAAPAIGIRFGLALVPDESASISGKVRFEVYSHSVIDELDDYIVGDRWPVEPTATIAGALSALSLSIDPLFTGEVNLTIPAETDPPASDEERNLLDWQWDYYDRGGEAGAEPELVGA